MNASWRTSLGKILVAGKDIYNKQIVISLVRVWSTYRTKDKGNKLYLVILTRLPLLIT